MPNNVVVDFESYYSKKSGISVATQGLPRYINDSYAYIVSVVSKDLGIDWVGEVSDAQKDFSPEFFRDPNNQFIAANSNFDQSWADHYWDGAASKNPRPWRCVLDRSAVQQFPHNLVGTVQCTLGRKVDKGLRAGMDGLDWCELSVTEQQAMLDYCLKDSRDTLDAYEALPDPSPLEEHMALHTRRINIAGVHVDQQVLEDHKTILGAVRHVAFHSLPWRETGTPLSHARLAEHCQKHGIPCPDSIAKTSDECEEAMGDNPEFNRLITAMRAYRRANKDIKKIETIEGRLTDDGRIPLEMIYCGALHTRRWSCRGVNIQNFDREPWKLGEFEASLLGLLHADVVKRNLVDGQLAVWSRHQLIPPPGKLFLPLDFSQVEPRCLNWLAGNDELLSLVASGFKVYEAYARVAKGWRGDKGTLKKELGVAAYTKIKNEVLGLGYGMGAGKYCDYAGVAPAEAEATVDSFRAKNPKIVQLWRKMDGVIRSAALSRSHELAVQMSTGDYLRYFGVRAKAVGSGHEGFMIKGDFSHASIQRSLWGGTLVENCLAGDMEVFSEARGWVPIQSVTQQERIFDGSEFVSHRGSKSMGWKTALTIDGIVATHDHRFLGGDGWSEFVDNRFNWYATSLVEERLHGSEKRGVDDDQMRRVHREAHDLGSYVPVRRCPPRGWEGTSKGQFLWAGLSAPSSEGQRYSDISRDVKTPSIRSMGVDEGSMPPQVPSSIQELRGSGDSSMPGMADQFSELLGRHGSDLGEGVGLGQEGQQRRVLEAQLPMGDPHSECQEPSRPPGSRRDPRHGPQERCPQIDALLPTVPGITHGGGGNCREVFDILDCGPRHRFAVRAPGSDRFAIAHNCTQRMARDVIAEAIMRLEKSGFRIGWTAHDEAILIVDKDNALDAKREAEHLMRVTPEWCPGLPLDVEGELCERYEK